MCNKSNFFVGMILGMVAGAAISCFVKSEKGHEMMEHMCESAKDMKHKAKMMAHKAKYKMHHMNDDIADNIQEHAEILKEEFNQ